MSKVKAEFRPKRRRPPSHHNEEEDEGNWIYSYADLLTLILCFFIIFYALAKKEGAGSNEVVKKIIETFSRNDSSKVSSSEVGVRNQSRELRAMHLLLAALNLEDKQEAIIKNLEGIREGDKDVEAAKAILDEELKKSGLDDDQHKQLATLLPKANVDIILPFATLFREGADQLTPDAEKRLATIAHSLLKIPSLSLIQVTGHTNADSYRRSRFEDNWALSAARAGSVAKVLIKYGVDAKLLSVAGAAELRPIIPVGKYKTTMGVRELAQNERVEITLKKPL